MAGVMEIDKSWVYECKLGEGSFGIVQLWKNVHNGEKIAIKKCRATDAQLTEKQKERWIQEIKIMKELCHPNIIATKPVPSEVTQSEPSLPVLCMEYCRKRDLRRVLNESDNWCGLPESLAIQIMKDISGAVEYLHGRHLTHRDLKPENVVLHQIQDKVVYKLIDLGYAKALGHDSMYASIVGTLNYVAPELLWKEKYTCSVDYWSLGILFYEIITGSRPFLPDEANPVKWRKHIEHKSYEDICAEHVNGSVVFLQHIQDPTDISPCIRDALVDWFRVVLQWDSKKRGRQCRDNSTDEIVVFKMLKRILSKKVVHIFCVYRYRVYSYEVDDTTTLGTLQSRIEIDTQIAASSQELVNSFGAVLKDDGVLQDTFLTLFRKEGMQLTELPPLHLPALVGNMIAMPKVGMSYHQVRRCYSAAMFFMKKEVELFRYYILALSMKIDLINSKFDTLLSKSSEMTSGIELLRAKFHAMSELLKNDINNGPNTWQQEVQNAVTKLERLSEIVNDLKAKCDKFLRIRETLREFGNVDWMTEYGEFLNKAQSIMESFRAHPAQSKHQPIHMARVIMNFLKFRHTKMKDPELAKIESQISLMTSVQVKEELSKLEKFVESACALTTVYRKEIRNLQKKWQNHKRAASTDTNVEHMEIESISGDLHSSISSAQSMNDTVAGSSDDVIYDNLVLRYMMHDIMTGTYETFLQIMNMDQ